jgi:hypothetical protein
VRYVFVTVGRTMNSWDRICIQMDLWRCGEVILRRAEAKRVLDAGMTSRFADQRCTQSICHARWYDIAGW